MSFWLWMFCLTTIGLLGYYLYLIIDWDWLNPHVFSKGFVFGKEMREEERVNADIDAAHVKWQTEVTEKIKTDVEAAAKRIKQKAFTEARLKELRDSIANPILPKRASMFPGSKTTKSKRLSNIEAAGKDPGFRPTIIGTVTAGVGPGPKRLRGKD